MIVKYMNINIYENHTCELQMKHEWNLILAVCYQLKQLKKANPKKKKIQACTGFEPMTLWHQCNALSKKIQSSTEFKPITLRYRCNRKVMGSNPVQAWIFFSGCFLTARVDSTLGGSNFTHVSSVVHIYDFPIFIFICFTIIGENQELAIDHLSMWLGSSVHRALHPYRKVMGSNPVQAWIFFFQVAFSTA